MGDIAIDKDAFYKRLQILYSTWEESPSSFAEAEAVLIPAGTSTDDIRYMKSAALQLWLFGYELPDTVMLFENDRVQVVTSSKKASLLAPLSSECEEKTGRKLALHGKAKGEDGLAQMQTLLEAIKDKKVGTVKKEQHEGKMMQAYREVIVAGVPDMVDVTDGLARALSIKDEVEQRHHRKASLLASQVMKACIREKFEQAVDAGKTLKHGTLAKLAEEALTTPKKIQLKLKEEAVDVAYDPIVQSSSQETMDLRITAETKADKKLDTAVFMCSLGARYQSYCAVCARTFFVNATADKEKKYKALLAAQGKVLAALTDGADLASVYATAGEALVAEGEPDLAAKLQKNIGFATGLEFREGKYVINAKSEGVHAKAGMVFNVILGVGPLEDTTVDSTGRGKNYSIQISDTVLVRKDGERAEILTDFSQRDWGNIAYKIEEDQDEDGDGDDDEDGEDKDAMKDGEENGLSGAMIGKENLRDRAQNENIQMQARQRDIAERKNEETLARLQRAKEQLSGGISKQTRSSKSIVAFKRLEDLIPTQRELVVQVDARHEALLIPIYGQLTPFHISTVKTVNLMSEQSDHSRIQIIFNTPGSHGPEGYDPAVQFPQKIFLKEVNFRSRDSRQATRVVQEAKALLRVVRSRDRERAEKATLVEQEKLIPAKGRIYRLQDVWCRPAVGTGRGRKVPGVLEAHSNGFRYTCPRSDEHVDVMYRNIKHCFLQESEGEHITLVHFTLHNPIMINKKKADNVQFFIEVMDIVQTLDGGRRNAYDPDEIEDEQREREKRNMINKTFRAFCRKVMEDIWDKDKRYNGIEFDKPYRDLGFHGVHSKSNVLLLPTAHCLVEMQEMPFLCISLDDIELVSLERVEFGSKSFDMIVVFKDFTKPAKQITSIPTNRIDTVRLWLTQSDTAFYEHRKNIKWSEVLKELIKDPEILVEGGGWKGILGMEDEEEEDDEAEESDFEPSSEESSEEVSDDDSESYADSDEEDSGEEDEDSEEEAGKSWAELEQEAKRADRESEFDDGDPRGGGKRKGGSVGGMTVKKMKR